MQYGRVNIWTITRISFCIKAQRFDQAERLAGAFEAPEEDSWLEKPYWDSKDHIYYFSVLQLFY